MKGKIKKFFSNLDLREVANAVLLLVLGVLFAAFPAGMLQTLCYVAGAFALLWGVLRLILCLRAEGGAHVYDVVICAAVMVAGVMLLIAPAFVSEFIAVLLGVLLILDSVFKITESRELYKLNRGAAEWLAAAITGGVCAVLGIIIIFNPFGTTRVLMIFVGVSLLLDAACSMAACVCSAVRACRAKDEGEVIDV